MTYVCAAAAGVCMTAQIMLVTPYMPLGCLLDYVRKNQENIGSKVLLDWCTQIASVSQSVSRLVHADRLGESVASVSQSPQ